MSESEQDQSNKAMGCGISATVVINLAMTIVILCHLKGFWRCLGAFFVFGIGGAVGGLVGMSIGMAIAKAQDEDNVLKQIGFSLAGILIGCVAINGILGNLIYEVNVIHLIR